MKVFVNILLGGLGIALTASLSVLFIEQTYLATKEKIQSETRRAKAKILFEIFPQTTHDNDLATDTFPLKADTPLLELRKASTGYKARKNGEVIGIILPVTARDGYAGDIQILVGINQDTSVQGVRLLAHRETAGLGDRVDLDKSNWLLSMDGRSLKNTPIGKWGVSKEGGEFDKLTGATITPKAILRATRRALEFAEGHYISMFEIRNNAL